MRNYFFLLIMFLLLQGNIFPLYSDSLERNLLASSKTTKIQESKEEKKLSPREFFLQGKKEYDKENYLKAIEILKIFTQENPYELEMRDALFLLGQAHQKKEQYLEALSYYNRLDSRFPHSQYRRKLSYFIGSSYYSLKIFFRARQNLETFIKNNKRPELVANELTLSHFYLAKMFQEERRYQNALSQYEIAYRLIQNYQPVLIKDKIFMQDFFFQMGSLYARYTNQKILAYSFLQKALKEGLERDDNLKFMLRELTLFHMGAKDGLKDISISDIQPDGDDIWIATWSGGVYRYVRSLEKMTSIPIPSPFARSIFIEQDSVFVATYDGIYIYNKRNGKVKRLSRDNSYFSLAQKIIKDDRYIYISTLTNGVLRYDYIRDESEVFDENSYIGSRQVYSMDANHKYLAFGTLARGAILVDKEKNQIHYINPENFSELKGRNIKAILIDGRYLWIAEHLSGIYKYDILRKKIILHDDRIHFPTSLLKREKEIWVGQGGDGIAIYQEDNKEISIINAVDGLYSNEVQILRSEDDYVWIGYLDRGIDILYYPFKDSY